MLSFLLLTCLFGCGQSTVTSQDIANNQMVEMNVNDKKYMLSAEDIFSMSYVRKTYLEFSLLSEKKDLSFMFLAYMTELKPGTFQVWDCKSASSCSQEEDDMNQSVIFAPYPKTPMDPLNLSRIAYNTTELGLKPLTLTISSVTEEQQAGMPFKTKRVKGQFTGTMAYIEKQQDNSWKIIGETTNIAGKFDVFCSLR